MKTFLSAILFVVSLLSLSTGPTLAQENKSTEPSKNQTAAQIKPIESTLPNGLKLIVVEDNREPKVYYHLGFQTEFDKDAAEDHLLGLFVAELIGKDTSTLNREQFAAEIKKLNAKLSTDSRVFLTLSGDAPSINNKAFLTLLSDAAINPSFPEDALQSAKAAFSKFNANLSLPEETVAMIKVSEALYGNRPFYFTVEHSKLVDKVTRDQVISFYKKKFLPKNAVLVVVGNVKAEDVKKTVNELFGKWPGGESSKRQELTPKTLTERAIFLIDSPKMDHLEIRVSFVGPNSTVSQDVVPMNVLSALFSGNTVAKLDSSRYSGVFSVKALAQAEVKEVLNAILSKIESIRNKPVSSEELKQAKLQFELPAGASYPPSSLANLIAQGYLLGHPSDYLIETSGAKINAATAADIQRVANKYLATDKAVITVVGKAGGALLDQLKLFAKNVEVFDQKGNRKELMAAANPNAAPSISTDIFEGVWNLDINFQGSPIKATLELKKQENTYKGTVKTELGDGQMTDATTNGNAIDGTITLNMYGQNIEIKFKGVVDKDTIKGTLSPKFQGVNDLPFTGTKAK